MNAEIMAEKADIHWEQAFMFVSEVSDLDPLGPGEMMPSEYWVVKDAEGDRVGLAVVDPDHNGGTQMGETVAWVYKLGVLDYRQGEGFGRALLEAIRDEYGTIELEIDSRKDANGFYEALGMDLVQENYAAMNDGTEGTMNVWRWE